jgi:cephalosporin hydroxylase
MTLTEIANKNSTDKGTEHYEAHGYTDHYEKYIPSTGNYTLLEIGVWHGDSLRMWKEYNPEMNLHGVDIDPRVTNHISPDEFNIHIGDQTDEKFLEDVVNLTGPLDFVIDDGSHVGEHIVKSFEILWKHVKPGGYYFIEDLHAGQADAMNTSIKILDIIDAMKPHHDHDLVWITPNIIYTRFAVNNKLLILEKP